MQIIRTLTAYNGENNTYAIKRLDEQPIQPNWHFTWSILDVGAGRIVSNNNTNSVVVVWDENTDSNQWFTVKCTVDMGDNCVKEVGIKVKVLSTGKELTAYLGDGIWRQCTRQTTSTDSFEEMEKSSAIYKAYCDGATKIIFNVTGGKFIKNNQLVSGPIQEYTDTGYYAYAQVAWTPDGPPFKITAQGSDNSGQVSNTVEKVVDVMPNKISYTTTIPEYRNIEIGAEPAIFQYTLQNLSKLPKEGGSLGKTYIKTYLYIGTLIDGRSGESDDDFEGINWITNDPITLIDQTTSSLPEQSRDTFTGYFPIDIPHTYNSDDKFHYRFSYYTEMYPEYSPENCKFTTWMESKDLRILYCPVNIPTGNITAISQWCIELIPTGNITIGITPCPITIPIGYIDIVPGLYDPKAIGVPKIIIIYIPRPVGDPVGDYIYTPKPFMPISIPTYKPKSVGDPTGDVIFIPHPIETPISIPTYRPKPFMPISIPTYRPKPFMPISIPTYKPKFIKIPKIIGEYCPRPIDIPKIVPTYKPKFIKVPIIDKIYIPRPIDEPKGNNIYVPKFETVPVIVKFYTPRPIGEPIHSEIDTPIYIPTGITKPKIIRYYRPYPIGSGPYTTLVDKIITDSKIDKTYTYKPLQLNKPYVIISAKPLPGKYLLYGKYYTVE